MQSFLIYCGGLFDWIEGSWESHRGQRTLASILVLFFIVAVAVIEMNRRGWLPAPFDAVFSRTHLAAIEQAFNLLLALEVLSLIFSLVYSVSKSVGKQFELLSLILLRGTFKQLSHFHEPLVWHELEPALLPIVASAVGALLIFVILGFFYKSQRPHPLSLRDEDRRNFVLTKKLIALLLLFSFLIIAVYDLWAFFIHGHPENTFESFYTMLIFSDVLIVLISLRYSTRYLVAFRNSAFSVATVLIRLALIAPALVSAMLGVGTALFGLGVSVAYNVFVDSVVLAKNKEIREGKKEDGPVVPRRGRK